MGGSVRAAASISAVLAAGVLVAVAAKTKREESVWQLLVDGALFILFALTVFNPIPLFPGVTWARAAPFLALAVAAAALAFSSAGSPAVALAPAWQWMTVRFSLLQVSVFGSAVVHACFTLALNVWPAVLQNSPHMQVYKIQPSKPKATAADWAHVARHVLASQLCVQLPLVSGLYLFVSYFGTPVGWESMPSPWDLAWRLALALVIDDTWVYFGHRALHDRRVYGIVHKVHHTYKAPFAPCAEYEHPVETAVLGVGFFTACVLLTNHLAFMWSWLFVRLVVTYDSHCGYDYPCNLLHLVPFYNGAKEHDWHHQCLNGMYAPTFVWWDRMLGTSVQFDADVAAVKQKGG